MVNYDLTELRRMDESLSARVPLKLPDSENNIGHRFEV